MTYYSYYMTIIVIKRTQLNASNDFYLSFAKMIFGSPEIVVHDITIMIKPFDTKMSQHHKKIRLSGMTYERYVARVACIAAIT